MRVKSIRDTVSDWGIRLHWTRRSRRSRLEDFPTSSVEYLEDRVLLASQLLSSDAPSHEVSPGQTIEVPVVYQTLNDNGQSAALRTDLISFNLHFDADQLTFVETTGVVQEGLDISPVTPRAESDVSVVGDDNDGSTETVLLARFTDSDSATNPGWPNAPATTGKQLYVARFRTKSGFTGTNINFSVNEAGTVPGTTQEYEFASNSLQLELPSQPTLTIADAPDVAEGAEQTFTVTLSPAADSIVTVRYSTENGDGPSGATAGEDFVGQQNQLLTFQPGETQKFITVETIDDEFIDPDENYTVRLSSLSGAIFGSFTATGEIIDQDGGQPRISISDAADVTEGEDSVFTVSLSRAPDSPVTVRYSTTDGDGPTGATNGQDIVSQENVLLTFNAGETSRTITVATIDDSLDESPEDFGVTLSSPTGAQLFRSSGSGLINDNDSGGPALRILDAPAVTEGEDAVFTVTLSPASTSVVTVLYSTSSGPGPVGATNGVDFTGLASLTLTFDPGETVKTISVATTDDIVDEPTEEFLITLSNAAGAAIDRSQAVGTINDNETPARRAGDVDGDDDFDANDSFLIQLVQLFATNAQLDLSKGGSDLTASQIRANVNQLGVDGDVDGDQDFDANDAFLIHLVQLFATNSQIDQAKGASVLSGAQIRANVISLGAVSGNSSRRASAPGSPAAASPPPPAVPQTTVAFASRRRAPDRADSPESKMPDEQSVHSSGSVGDFQTVAVFDDSFRSWIDAL